jgi:hypothetical protein
VSKNKFRKNISVVFAVLDHITFVQPHSSSLSLMVGKSAVAILASHNVRTVAAWYMYSTPSVSQFQRYIHHHHHHMHDVLTIFASILDENTHVCSMVSDSCQL